MSCCPMPWWLEPAYYGGLIVGGSLSAYAATRTVDILCKSGGGGE